MADAAVSNTAEGNLVWVRIPPPVPDRRRPGTPTDRSSTRVIATVLAALGLIASVVAGCSGPAVSPSAEAELPARARTPARRRRPQLDPRPRTTSTAKFSQRIERASTVSASTRGRHGGLRTVKARSPSRARTYAVPWSYGPDRSASLATSRTRLRRRSRRTGGEAVRRSRRQSEAIPTSSPTFGLQPLHRRWCGRHARHARRSATCDMPALTDDVEEFDGRACEPAGAAR